MATLVYSTKIQTIDEHGRCVIYSLDPIPGTMGVEYLDKTDGEKISEETEASKRAMEEYKKKTDLEEAQREGEAATGPDTDAEEEQREEKSTEGSETFSSSA